MICTRHQLSEPGAAGKVCRICEASLTVHQVVRGGICDDPDCRRKNASQQALQRQREQRLAAEAAAGAHHRLVARRLGLENADTLPLRLVPYFQSELGQLPAARRDTLRENLAALIEAAFAQPPPGGGEPSPEAVAPRANRAVDHVSGTACSTCRGSCCRHGGEEAYLRTSDIQQWVAGRPGLTPADVLDQYLALVPLITFVGSCIYHGPEGCNLPREMRSAICNQFYCSDLLDLRNEMEESPLPKLLVVAVGDASQLRSVLIEYRAGDADFKGSSAVEYPTEGLCPDDGLPSSPTPGTASRK